MNPLSTSSLNAERARVDASRSAPTPDLAHAPDTAGGGFAALLRGAQTPAVPEATAPSLMPKADAPASPATEVAKPASALASPTTAASQNEAKARHAAQPRKPVEPPQQANDSMPVQRVDGHDDASMQDKEDTAATGDTLAHWLLNQGAYLADPAQAAQGRAGGLPPPQNAATASDDLTAAALAREVLDGVRSRAKAASAGKPGSATPGAQADDADTARREAASRGLKTGRADEGIPGQAAVSASEPPPVATARHAEASGRFDEQLTAALQVPMPEPVTRPVDTVTSSLAATVTAEQPIDTPVNHPSFGEAVGVTISQLARNGVHEARLQLNPAELGPVSVHIAMNGQEARIELGAAQAQTRALLDASLPALTEAFRADGLVLAASQVSDWQDPRAGASNPGSQGDAAHGQGQSGAQSGAGGQPRGAPARTGWVGRADSGDVPLPAPASWRGRGLGGLDLYA